MLNQKEYASNESTYTADRCCCSAETIGYCFRISASRFELGSLTVFLITFSRRRPLAVSGRAGAMLTMVQGRVARQPLLLLIYDNLGNRIGYTRGFSANHCGSCSTPPH